MTNYCQIGCNFPDCGCGELYVLCCGISLPFREVCRYIYCCVDISTVCCTYCAEPGCSLLGLVKGKFNLLENETKLEISRIRKWRKLGEFYRISWILRRRRKLFTESLIAWFYYHLEYFKFCVDILINWWFIFGYPHPWKTHSFHLSHFWAAFYTFYSALKIKL